jgi:8-oxo-dGTP diphosphatase
MPEPSRHRISAGAFVLHEDRILLVRHHKPGAYDFWVAPGGGVIGSETLAQAAAREMHEETGLSVVAGELLYVEEFHSPDTRYCKFWLHAELRGGVLSTNQPEARAEHIVEAAWWSRAELRGLVVFPEVLRERYWQDQAAGVRGLRHLGLREMQFW